MTELVRLDALFAAYPETWGMRYGYVTWFRAQHDDWPFLSSTPETAELIAALHNAYPALRDEIASLRDRLAAVTAERDALQAELNQLEPPVWP